jgi:tRNA dimethylallyltransferase
VISPTPVLAIVGATATGKSAVAVEVAQALGAEIVSIDSMQAYEGLDAGTDKPTPEMRARVAHHLVDTYPLLHDLTAAEFQAAARAAIDDIRSRGKHALLVGGSGLYFRAVVDDLRFAPRAPEIRRRLEGEAAHEGAPALHARLARLDPLAAARIEPGNARRVVRALEAIEISGDRFSATYAWPRYDSVFHLRVAGLRLPRVELFERIAARVDRMLADGLVDEARALEARGLSRTARQAVGYRQVLAATPEAGDDDVRPAIVAATKRLARRQESWFGADPRVEWFDARAPGLAAAIGAFLAAGETTATAPSGSV